MTPNDMWREMSTNPRDRKTPYIPKIDDYVIWKRSTGHIDEGWVYFVDNDYITIETGVKDKPNCEYTVKEKHKKIHILVVCHNFYWDQLKYVKHRRTID